MIDADDIRQIRALAELEGLDPDKCVELAISRERRLKRRCVSEGEIGPSAKMRLREYKPAEPWTDFEKLIRGGMKEGLSIRAIARAMDLSESKIRRTVKSMEA